MNSWSNRCGGRPPIFEFYVTEFPLPEEGNFRAICKVCNTSISASRRATSNLISHMKRKHPGVYHDNGGGGVGALPRPSDSAALAPLGGPPNPVQQYVDQRQQQVTEALVDLLAGSLLDPGLVDTREFRRLLSLLDSGYEPPSASQLVYGLLPGGLRGFFGVFLGCAMVPGRHHWLLRLQRPHSGSLDFPPRKSREFRCRT